MIWYMARYLWFVARYGEYVNNGIWWQVGWSAVLVHPPSLDKATTTAPGGRTPCEQCKCSFRAKVF